MSVQRLIFRDRAHRAIDALLPEHTHKGTSLRFWTTAIGVFSLDLDAGHHPDKRFVFVCEDDGWRVEVPLTAAGLDALTVAMVLAGAIEAPTAPSVRSMGTRGPELFAQGVELIKQATAIEFGRYGK